MSEKQVMSPVQACMFQVMVLQDMIKLLGSDLKMAPEEDLMRVLEGYKSGSMLTMDVYAIILNSMHTRKIKIAKVIS